MTTPAHQPIKKTGVTKLFTGRSSNFKNNVGGQGCLVPNESEVHHVMPCGALTHTKEDYIASFNADSGTAEWVVHETVDYDVNLGDNLLGLPTRIFYARKFGTPLFIMPPKLPPLITGTGRNWPCHTIAHNKYSDNAESLMKAVWTQVKLKFSKQHKPVSATDIGQDIRDTSDDLREGLERPGTNRTQANWAKGKKSHFALYPFPP